ncbi:upstream of flc-like protein [Tanacetum coccineum]
MATDARKSTSEMLTSRRPKKNRTRASTTHVSCRDQIINNAPDTSSSPLSVKSKMDSAQSSPAVHVMPARKVPVLYYLTRNGHIEHPHLIDVPLSSPYGLYLRDVMNTLNYHRGIGMANLYSWSFKRSYKNGYVWHDLSEDDLVEPTNSHDYILKGSELLQTTPSQTPLQSNHSNNNYSTTTPPAALAMIRRRNQSWSSFDNPQEYMVVKCESSRELAAKFAADAATQTATLRREEVPSPPPSNSSSEIYADQAVEVRDSDVPVKEHDDGSVRTKASHVLMQLITCGGPSRLKMQVG